MRRILRSVAHANMEKKGMTRINKHTYSGPAHNRQIGPSLFARRWRDYVSVERA